MSRYKFLSGFLVASVRRVSSLNSDNRNYPIRMIGLLLKGSALSNQRVIYLAHKVSGIHGLVELEQKTSVMK